MLKRTNNRGEVNFSIWDGSEELTVGARPDLYRICEYESHVESGDLNNSNTINVGIEVINHCADLGLSSVMFDLRRCFDNTYHLEIYNDGSAAAQNTIAYIELDEHFDFISSDYPVISQVGKSVALDIGVVEPRDASRGKLEFNLSCDAELGQAHYVSATLEYEVPCAENTRRSTTSSASKTLAQTPPSQ